MQSEKWRQLRRMAIKRDEHKCFICDNEKNLEVHHCVYPKDIFKTKLYCVITLCRKCHLKIHRKVEL